MTEWQPFRRKVAVIQAKQLQYGDQPVAIETLEGTIVARPGDWILQGIKGELYPVRDDIFRELYEPLPTDGAAK